ncbi:hypothetical protein ACE41F_26620 [Bacillus cereus]|uniref:hypothetical protein n=1 Tax=Bacillus cereus TaxID=1396 RepID=UPI0035CA78C8
MDDIRQRLRPAYDAVSSEYDRVASEQRALYLQYKETGDASYLKAYNDLSYAEEHLGKLEDAFDRIMR